MNFQVVEECTKLSDEGKMTFPETVMRLDKAGIESYAANLLVPNKIYYAGNESHEVSFKLKGGRKVGAAFRQEDVVKAIRAIQANQIDYQEFLRQIMDAGVIFYLVFIKGRKVIYFGRNGEQHLESFPSNP